MGTEVKSPRVEFDADARKRSDWGNVLIFNPYDGLLNKALMLLVFCWSLKDLVGLFQAGDAGLEAWLKESTMFLIPVFYAGSLMMPWMRGRRLAWGMMCACCVFSLALQVSHWWPWEWLWEWL